MKAKSRRKGLREGQYPPNSLLSALSDVFVSTRFASCTGEGAFGSHQRAHSAKKASVMRKSILSVLSCLVPLCAASSAFAAAPSLLMPNYGTSVLNYDVSTGAFLGVFASGGGLTSANGLGFGPSGDLYVVDSSTSNVLRYDGGTGAFVGVFSNATNCWYQPTFGPDGNLYVGCSGGTIQRFNGTTGASLGVFVPAPSGSVDFGGMAFFNGSLFVTYVVTIAFMFCESVVYWWRFCRGRSSRRILNNVDHSVLG